MKFKIFTLLPEIFPGYLNYSIIGEALKKEIFNLDIIDIRDFAKDKRKTVDNYPCGGGSGMVIKPDILGEAIETNINKKTKLIYLSPRGKVFNQQMSIDLAKEEEIGLICGRYEGVDQRVLDEYDIEEVSIGDYVLSGGELPAMTMIDAIVRNLDGVIAQNDSLKEESFGNGKGSEFENLLEYPQYTKPTIWKDREVPKILLSGHHQKIKDWRLEKAKEVTEKNRKDLV